MWAGAMVALYGGVIAFISLVFSYIDYAFPDTLSYWGDPYSGISYQMAALIVLAPVFLGLMRFIRRDIARDSSRNEIWVRRWALFLTVFVAGAAIVIDLITLLTTFLSGEEISVRFLLKVAIVLLVAAAGFMHFLADIWGFWNRYPGRARSVNWAVGILVLFSVISGFFIAGTPQQARQYRLDEQRVSDLENIKWQVVSYWQRKGALPANLGSLNDEIGGYNTPADPTTGIPYEYRTTGNLSFELCATFARESRIKNAPAPEPAYSRVPGSVPDSWMHGEGRTCFKRTIDPDLYPVTPKPTAQ